MNTTIQTHNGHIYHLKQEGAHEYFLTTKPTENITIATTITEKEAQQLRHATITIRELLEKIQKVFIGNKDTSWVHYKNIEDIIEYLPELDDRHNPLP